MIIHSDYEQGSVPWFEARAGKITASEADRLVTPLGKIKTGDGPKTFLIEKVAERWLGGPLPATFTSFAAEQGSLLESFARPAFEFETGMKIKQVAFLESDDSRCGCSPDGIVDGQEIGLEIKSPQIINGIRWLLDGCLPEDFILQIQFSLFVTGWNQWMFCSFRRGWRPLIVRVEPDAKMQSTIVQAVSEFTERFDDAWESFVKLNGPPPERKKFTPTPGKPMFTWQQSGDVPIP